MPDFDNLLTDDQAWAAVFRYRAGELDDNTEGQLALWPVDDVVGTRRYVRCPRRGLHTRLVECWMCWCDWAAGYATASELLAPGAIPPVSP